MTSRVRERYFLHGDQISPEIAERMKCQNQDFFYCHLCDLFLPNNSFSIHDCSTRRWYEHEATLRHTKRMQKELGAYRPKNVRNIFEEDMKKENEMKMIMKKEEEMNKK